MQLDEQLLRQIATNVYQTTLGLELTSNSDETDLAHQLVASVAIRGTHEYIVKVFADEQLISNIAEAMFSSDRKSLSEEEIRDAFREIANMIGGNVKCHLGEETDLDLPIFGEAFDALDHLPIDCIRTTLMSCGSPLTIVFQRQTQEIELVGPRSSGTTPIHSEPV